MKIILKNFKLFSVIIAIIIFLILTFIHHFGYQIIISMIILCLLLWYEDKIKEINYKNK
jgi:hypothetical protein